MNRELFNNMKDSKRFYINILASLLLMGFISLLTACGSDSPKKAVIEDSEGGLELLEREFGECDDSAPDLNVPQYLRRASDFDNISYDQYTLQNQLGVSSLGQMYPDRGSFRQTKDEILDVVERYVWSPERSHGVKLLSYFDMVLLINVAPRDSSYPQDSSAQTMQVLVRNGFSNNLRDWDRIETWPISSGVPCGKKIETFTGVYKFNPDRIYKSYKSKVFDDIDMYETMFLYHRYLSGQNTGVAIHGSFKTTHLGRPDSGGCIRIYQENSQCLYETIEGRRSNRCLSGGHLNYRGTVPSLLPRFGEADPSYSDNGGRLETSGIRVMIAIFNEKNDLL